MKTKIRIAPPEVRIVRDLARANARAANQPRDRAYCFYQESLGIGEWVICDNYESGIPALIYRSAGFWYSREPSTGEDVLLRGGFEEAKASAEIFFTG